MNTPRMQEAWDKSSRTADGFYSSQTPTSECATSCYDEGCKLERELAHAIRERDEWEAKFIQQNKDLGCEQMDPNGTIWDYAKTLQRDLDELRRERDEARDAAVKAKAYKRLLKQTNAQLKRERDELKALLTKEQGAVTISRNGYVQELERERDELKALLTKEQDACARERKRWEASLWQDVAACNGNSFND
jgi:hypothetical protein